MDLLAHPFRLGADGAAVTHVQGTDDANAEQLAVLVTTRRSERILAPLFGIDDPAFVGVSASDVVLGVELFGPDVEIIEVTERVVDPSTVEVRIAYA